MSVSDDVVQRIQKMMNMTVENGCTPAEAAHAAAKVQELMQKHSLSMFDVEKKTYDEAILIEELETGKAVVPEWMGTLAVAVAPDCKVIWWRHGGPTKYLRFIGYKTDAQVASYMYDTLSRALLAEADKQGRHALRTGGRLMKYKADFMQYAALAIYKRTRKEQETFKSSSNTAGALVCVKGTAVDKYIEDNLGTIKWSKETTKQKIRDRAATQDGWKAGSEIPLRQGIEGQAQGRLACD